MEERDELGNCVEARKVNQDEWEAPPLVTEMLIERQVKKQLQDPILFSGLAFASRPIFTLISFSSMCQDLGHPGHAGLHSCECRDFTELECAGLYFPKLFWVFFSSGYVEP